MYLQTLSEKHQHWEDKTDHSWVKGSPSSSGKVRVSTLLSSEPADLQNTHVALPPGSRQSPRSTVRLEHWPPILVQYARITKPRLSKRWMHRHNLMLDGKRNSGRTSPRSPSLQHRAHTLPEVPTASQLDSPSPASLLQCLLVSSQRV